MNIFNIQIIVFFYPANNNDKKKIQIIVEKE